MAEFKLKYGKEKISFEIPDERIIDVVEGASYPALADPEKAFIEALDNPVGTKALKEIVKPGETVCIVVSDVTRGWIGYSRFLPTLLNYLNAAGIEDKDMFLLVAYGAHREHSEKENRAVYGDEAVDRIRIEHSSAIDPACTFRHVGETSFGVPIELNELALDADRLILTGGLIYHLMAGYGAGRKAILPGISSYESIQRNHNLCLNEEVGSGCNKVNVSGNIATNRMHFDQMEHGKAADADFLINVINNTEDKVARYVTGDWEKAWLDGVKTVDQIYGVPVKGLADCVIASSGGFPKDINLYQGVKTQDNAVKACREGGVVILLMELDDIAEPPEFINWFDYTDLYDREVHLRAGFTVPGFVALHMGEDTKKFHHIVVTKPENKAVIEKTGMSAAASLEEALQKAEELLGKKDFTVTVMPLASNTMPISK